MNREAYWYLDSNDGRLYKLDTHVKNDDYYLGYFSYSYLTHENADKLLRQNYPELFI